MSRQCIPSSINRTVNETFLIQVSQKNRLHQLQEGESDQLPIQRKPLSTS